MYLGLCGIAGDNWHLKNRPATQLAVMGPGSANEATKPPRPVAIINIPSIRRIVNRKIHDIFLDRLWVSRGYDNK